ncbi:immunity 49 family protein [Pyxidicoccus parkwayensis]|uniref:Immunity 49 family protein n=1 Tax=Pyxidicoccus parkwayensis TaxID=2813578 RepID=A0ABX7NKR1_9BACT|nr:Imm49 family immunity protein [Pyxidicoccus parkwaysis]QSQ19026.1 immunity 49 family protein [Pyxidicoccus parkwaysis]
MDRLRDTAVYEDDLASALRNLEDAELPLELAGEFCEEATSLLRVLAICRLLREADVDGFHHDLHRSALSRRDYLARCEREGYADHFTVASRTEPFFDALAAGSLALARDLAKRAAPGPREGEEYPEDYHYANLLHRHVLVDGQDETGELERLLTTLEAHQDGARVDLCRSLVRHDGRSFEAAFQALLEERANEVARQEAHAMTSASAITNGYIFIEGLAWMRLAEHARPPLPVPEECRFCPALARMPMQRPFPGDRYPLG